jgi:hypothetical protein
MVLGMDEYLGFYVNGVLWDLYRKKGDGFGNNLGEGFGDGWTGNYGCGNGDGLGFAEGEGGSGEWLGLNTFRWR